ncbi:hypothetical protein JW930_05745 [Candidatus Woesearchaeota archaeon]|nr:hypothetical protein [Candidatus Woesearchaeota archaeon]
MRKIQEITWIVIILGIFFLISSAYTVNAGADNNRTQCEENYGLPNWVPDTDPIYTDFWSDRLIGQGYWPACCANNNTENFETRACNESQNAASTCHFCENNPTDKSCCDSDYDCVFDNVCYATNEAHELDGQGEADAYCFQGNWTDCDASTTTCSACDSKTGFSSAGTNYFVTAGESGVGEYDATGGGNQCCGDDANEYYTNFNCTGAISFCSATNQSTLVSPLCCGASTKCAFNNACYSTGSSFDVDTNGDDDICLNGLWVDCSDNSDCSGGELCVDNSCYDENAPIKPHVWPVSGVSVISSVDIIGYNNESMMNISVDLRCQNMSIYHTSTISNGSSGFYGSAITTEALREAGTDVVTIPDTPSNRINFSQGNWVEFSNHNYTHFYRYNIIQAETAGDNWQLTLGTELLSDVPVGVTVKSFNSTMPTGWFNISLTLCPGNNTIFVFSVDGSGNKGPSRNLVSFYDISGPTFNLTNAPKNHTSDYQLNILVNDEGGVNRSTLEMNFTTSSQTYTYNNDGGMYGWYNLNCVPEEDGLQEYNCSPFIMFEDGKYNLTLSAVDTAGLSTALTIVNFTIDTSEDSTLAVYDTGMFTSFQMLNATWTPYYDLISELDYYEYAIGIALYPYDGWNSLRAWNSVLVNYTNVSLPGEMSYGETYFFNVRARTKAGLYTDVAWSDGITYQQSLANTLYINSAEDITITYMNTSNSVAAEVVSDHDTAATVYKGILYNVRFSNLNTTSIVLLNVNISNLTYFSINASYPGLIDSESGNIGSSLRYRVRDAYAFEIISGYTDQYLVEFNYTSINSSISNENSLIILKMGYNFSSGQVNYNNIETLTVSRNTSLDIITGQASGFSVFALVEDTQIQEICGDGIDNDGDGEIDEDCVVSGGGRRKDKAKEEPLPEQSGSCSDGIKNQDETDSDCGGVCAAQNKTCAIGKHCIRSSDCSSNYCRPFSFVCAVPSCTDNIQNQGEEGVDCGGPCSSCGTCSDSIKNQEEEGVDCGGPCGPCVSCSDGIQNQGEEGVDCGGPCRSCASCNDGIRNQGEEDIDCGGPCEGCPQVEQPLEQKGISPVIIAVITLIIVGALLAVFMLSKKKPEKPADVRQITQPQTMPAPVQQVQHPIQAAAVPKPLPPLKLKEETLLKLQRYVNYCLGKGKLKADIANHLKELHWPHPVISDILHESGEPELISALIRLNDYLANSLLGLPRKEIRYRLRREKWPHDLIDLVLYRVYLISDSEHLRGFILHELAQKKSSEDIKDLLCRVGWPSKVVDRELAACNAEFKRQMTEIKSIIKDNMEKMSQQQLRGKMLETGLTEDLVDAELYDVFSEEKNIKRLRQHINRRIANGESIKYIKESLIKAGWAIDLITKIISSNFVENDLRYLIKLDKYIDSCFEKGMTKRMIKNELLAKKWAEEYVDMVMSKVHIVDDKVDKVKDYINHRLVKGDSADKITSLLLKVGWSHKLISGIFDNNL